MNTDRPTTPNERCDHVVDHVHGTFTCYKVCGCRCDDCSKANAAYVDAYKKEKVRTPAHRRGEQWEPRSPEWLAAMRRGLLTAVVKSFERDGESRFL